MERRALIAAVLSILVVLVYYALVQRWAPSPDARDGGSGPAPQQPVPPPPKPPPQASPLGEPPPQGRSAESMVSLPTQEVTVETSLFKMVLDGRRAVLKQVWLKQSRSANGSPLALFASGQGQPLTMALATSHEVVNDGQYEPSTGQLVLSPRNPKGSIRFTLREEGKVLAQKTLTFHDDRYGVDVSIAYAQPPPGQGTRWATVMLEGALNKEGSTSLPLSSADHGPALWVNDGLVREGPKVAERAQAYQGRVSWIALQNRYFAVALIPKEQSAMATIRQPAPERYAVELALPEGGARSGAELILYLGPKQADLLRLYHPKLDRLIDFGYFGLLAIPLMRILNLFYKITGNYGVAIILLTVLIKLLFYPLSHKSLKSMKAMQGVQPQLRLLQETYKNDRQRLNREVISLYRAHKVNPLGGCLPMLLQIPVFIALYNALSVAVELRQAPFLWIRDLSSHDPTFVLPILMGASMAVQQKMTPTTVDPTQAKVMMLMPVIFTVMFLWFPVGLVVYWLVNNLLTILQQHTINKWSAGEGARAPGPAA